MNKKSMSVPEMRRLLGLGKTESYWLIKKRYFETIIIAGKMRVMVESFNEWYDNQLHYKKVNGDPPGKTGQQLQCPCRKQQTCLGSPQLPFTNYSRSSHLRQ